jgi:glycosyltransferase involved in cell wall biosynthesis
VLFSAGDSDELAGEISRLLDNEEQRQEIGKRGRQWVESERSWMKTTEGYENIYAHVLESSEFGIQNKVR